MVKGRSLCCWLLFLWVAGAWAEEVPELFIETELNPPDPYVQAQVEYRVRLYRRPIISQGSLILPEMTRMVVEPLPEGEVVEVERHGRLYRMQEQRYLLFPQVSGLMRLPAPRFSGREQFAQGPELELQVRPRPGDYADGAWLPAQSMRLKADWVGSKPPWYPGDVVERVITVEAQGLTGAQLPLLSPPEIPGVHFQVTGDRVENEFVDGQLVGRRIQHQRLVFGHSGAFRLPALRLMWWHNDLQRPMEALLVPEDIEIRPAPAGSQGMEPEEIVRKVAPGESPWINTLKWEMLLLGLLLLLGLGLSVHWWLSPKAGWRRAEKVLLKRVEAACLRGDAVEAAAGLLDWGRLRWDCQAPSSLGGIAHRLQDRGLADLVTTAY